MLLDSQKAFAATKEPKVIRVALTIAEAKTLEIWAPPGSKLLNIPDDTARLTQKSLLRVVRNGWNLQLPQAHDSDSPTSVLSATRAEAMKTARLIRSETGHFPKKTPADYTINWNGQTVANTPTYLVLTPPKESDIISINGNNYRGQLLLKPRGSWYQFINVLSLETYLYSVVGSEVPSNWPMEALKAQAVAARTYAVRNLSPRKDHDICDTEYCQAYKGVSAETTPSVAAVNKTSGLIATYNNKAIDALYTANTGGITANSEEVWGNYVPYLRSVTSTHDDAALESNWGFKSFNWSRSYELPELNLLLKQQGFIVDAVHGLSIPESGTGGRAITVVIDADPNPIVLQRDSIRAALDVSSTLFTVEAEHARLTTRIVSTPTAMRSNRTKKVSSYRRSIAFDLAPIGISLVNNSVFTRKERTPETITLRGSGLGHGLGMSQWGAKGMADQGYDYRDILHHYYNGIELTKLN
tara:strand:- start:962 stop:2371 length:1410 start_codon:yes stop_codon:yes gene_type:complete